MLWHDHSGGSLEQGHWALSVLRNSEMRSRKGEVVGESRQAYLLLAHAGLVGDAAQIVDDTGEPRVVYIWARGELLRVQPQEPVEVLHAFLVTTPKK